MPVAMRLCGLSRSQPVSAVHPLSRPVTPEVAGSSPVAPAFAVESPPADAGMTTFDSIISIRAEASRVRRAGRGGERTLFVPDVF
jgi:hypothetical protein